MNGKDNCRYDIRSPILSSIRYSIPNTNSSTAYNVGEVYSFTPTMTVPYLLVSALPSIDSHGNYLINRKAILVVLAIGGNSWRKIICGGIEGWIWLDGIHKSHNSNSYSNNSSNSNNSGSSSSSITGLKRIDSLYKYEDWRGNSYFFCYGRVMIGSDGKMFLFTNLALFTVMVLFFIFIAPRIDNYEAVMVSIL